MRYSFERKYRSSTEEANGLEWSCHDFQTFRQEGTTNVDSRHNVDSSGNMRGLLSITIDTIVNNKAIQDAVSVAGILQVVR